MSLKELREKKARLIAEARERLDQIGKNTDEARAKELEAAHDAAMAECDRVDGLIQREIKQAEIEARANAGDPRRPIGSDVKAPALDQGFVADYRHAFSKWVHDGMDALSQEERAVLRDGAKASHELRAQTAGTASAGGYTVPTELMKEIDIALKAGGPMYDDKIVRTVTTGSGHQMTLPTIDDTSSEAEAHTEGAEVTNDGGKDVTVGQKTLDAFAYDSEWIRWSWILESDSDFAWEGILGELIGERLARKANGMLTTGSGSSAPHGILTASGVGKTTASETAVTADEVMEFVHSIDPAYRRSAKFGAMFNDSTLLALRKLKDGEGNYLVGEAPDGSGRLKIGAVTLPYHINQDMPSIGAGKKFMVAGDFGRYFVRKVGRPIMFVAREKFAPNLGILGLIRFDGELANSAAVKHMANKAGAG